MVVAQIATWVNGNSRNVGIYKNVVKSSPVPDNTYFSGNTSQLDHGGKATYTLMISTQYAPMTLETGISRSMPENHGVYHFCSAMRDIK
jgi:hypothetical protein